MSMKYMSTKNNKNNESKDESMECLQAQLCIDNMKNKEEDQPRDKPVLGPNAIKT